MLAYLLWHRPAEGTPPDTYELACAHFHRSLHHAPPAGFRGSAVFRTGELSWPPPAQPTGEEHTAGFPNAPLTLEPGGQRPARAQPRDGDYEDWYFVEDFTALGVLNEAAVAHGHRSAHDDVARRFGAGAGGLYSLREGQVDPQSVPSFAVWVTRPPGSPSRALGELLGDGMDPGRASLWRRALVLGPAPEYCLLTPEPPAGVAPTRLPQGWRATVREREMIWHG